MRVGAVDPEVEATEWLRNVGPMRTSPGRAMRAPISSKTPRGGVEEEIPEEEEEEEEEEEDEEVEEEEEEEEEEEDNDVVVDAESRTGST